MQKASVVGLGKLGAPLLAVLARQGFEVWGIDLSSNTVAKIGAGIAPVNEPKLQELLTTHNSRIRATSDWSVAIGNSNATFLLVPTPSDADGSLKNEYLFAAVDELGRVLRTKPDYHLVIISSTVMPGSVGGPIRDRLESISGKRIGRDIGLCYNPEFVALGNVVDGLLKPDFVLIGESDPQAGAMLEGITRRVVGEKVPIARMNLINAELTKLAINTYVTMKISFANMLAEICDNLDGADADVVTAAIGRDTRIGTKYLRAATGYGGPCFPRDTIAFARMARQAGVEANLALATDAINERQLGRLTAIVTQHTSIGERVAVLGLAYKPDTPIIEHAQGVMLAAALSHVGRQVIVHDPLARDVARAMLGPKIEFANSAAEAVTAADAVVVMVPWKDYIEFFAAWSDKGRVRLIIDCWHIVDRARSPQSIQIVQLGRRQGQLGRKQGAIAGSGAGSASPRH
jgi:UDPglucose 6-dehydrogenase